MIDFIEQNAVWIIIALFVALIIELVLTLIPRRKTEKKENSSLILDEISGNGSAVYVVLKKQDNTVAFVSKNIENMTGLQVSDITADVYAILAVIEESDKELVESNIQRALADDGQETGDIEFVVCPLNMPEKKNFKMTIKHTKDAKYDVLELTDITDEVSIRENLNKRIEEVQAIDESKTVFLSKMSHEIRTPMNGMLGMISLAKISQQQGKDEEANEYLEKAEALTQFLLSIINDILDMSRIESGKLELEHVPFSLKDMVKKIQTMFETTITSKGIGFDVQMQDFTINNIIGDELRITQVLNNFLSNASKFTPAGGHISLYLRQMELSEGNVSIMFRVKDDGIGMSAGFLRRIFVPFEQEDSGIARKFGGSGLGMAISDNLVHQMGGNILVDSEEGKGSEFTVYLTLPVATEIEEAKNTAGNEPEMDITGMRMLLAEDNDINALIAMKLLDKRGLVVERAENGKVALDKFAASEKGYYDAILMDIHMPVMDGWQATQEIRKLERDDAGIIPIIALSADAFVEDKRHSISIGMNGHIAKPIDFDELSSELKKCIKIAQEQM